MRVLVALPAPPEELRALDQRYPLLLFPLGDRPFLIHVVEQLVHHGAREIIFTDENDPARCEHWLGDGERWGCEIRYQKWPHVLQPTVFGRADSLPPANLSLQVERGPKPLSGQPWIVVHEDLPQDFSEALQLCPRGDRSLTDWQSLLDLHRNFLDGELGLTPRGREAAPGVRTARGTRVHPSAKLVAPVYLGPHVEIGAGAEIGPHAVICENSVVGRDCRVRNSVVLPDTYLGDGLDLDQSLAHQGWLVSLPWGTPVEVRDPTILGALEAR